MPLLTRPDAQIGYDSVGEGRAVILIPGGGSPRQSWQPVAERLVREGYRVVSTDLRGCGESTVASGTYTVEAMADDIVALLDDLGLGRATLIGHSLGGVVALEAALRHPTRVEGLVLFGSPMMSRLNRAWCEWLALALDRSDPLPLTVPILLSVFPPSALQDDATVEMVLDMLSGGPEPDSAGLVAQSRALVHWTGGWADRSLAALDASCLIVSFEFDLHSPPALGRLTADLLPNARHAVIDGHGHAGVQTADDDVVRHVLAFLAEAAIGAVRPGSSPA